MHRQGIDAQPLGGEVVAQGAGAGIFDHAADLLAEGVGFVEALIVGELEELFVGHGGPEEIGEAGGECVIAQRIDAAFLRLGLDEKEEAWGDEDAFEGEAQGGFEGSAAGLGLVEEGEEAGHLGLPYRMAEGATGEGEEDFAGGGVGGEFVSGVCDEEALAGFGDFRGELSLAARAAREEDVEDLIGGLEVFFDLDGGDEEAVADGVETFAARTVLGKDVAGAEVEADEVADGVVVFGAGEAAAHDVPAIEDLGVVAGDLGAIDFLPADSFLNPCEHQRRARRR